MANIPVRCRLFGHKYEFEDLNAEDMSFRATCARGGCGFETEEKEPVAMYP